MEISVGHTPDSDDAFMFYGMFTGKVTSPDFTVNHVIEDIEQLNLKASCKSRLGCHCSVSSCMCTYSRIIQFCEVVVALELDYGPIVVANEANHYRTSSKNVKIAIPGKMTSAIFTITANDWNRLNHVEMNFQ